MEEGKRMFSIFAARMFEQRVLQAYREKVAQERQLQLLRELDDEDKITKDREMKRQNQNQKKKDKKRYVMLIFLLLQKTLKGVCDSRQQKQAKEEERALKAADKAAEEAAAKARQAALDDESRKKRDEERGRREAAKREAEEQRLRKEEEKKKRALEEREREQDRERKRKEKEDKSKKEREEREKKAKEEREARLAKEKEEKDRVEKEKVEKDRKAKEKAEKEAKEKLAAQQRSAAAASSNSSIASGSGKGSARANNAVASSSTATAPVKSNSSSTSSVAAPALQRLPNNSGGSINNDTPSKRPANKPIPTLVTSPLPPGILGQSTRPTVQQPNLSRPSHLPSPTPINSQQPHLPQPPHSAGMMYGHPQGPVVMSPTAMSPRLGNFPPMAYGYGGPNMQHPPPLSPVPARTFNGGSFDPTFNRGMPIGVGVPLGVLPPQPIGPPTKAAKTATQSTASAGLAPGQGRHASASSNDASGPGPITRPMAPIARPTAGGGNGEAASSGSGSPSRRSPSPSRVLGSSALAADDDEVVPAHGTRRATAIGIGTMPIGGAPGGQNWGSASPRSALSEANLRGGPWTASAFSSARTTIAPSNHLHQLHHPGPMSPSLWGNTSGNGNGENWHPQSPGFFSGPPYINHNAAASSTPHTST